MYSAKYPFGFRSPLDKSPQSNVPRDGEDVSTWAQPPAKVVLDYGDVDAALVALDYYRRNCTAGAYIANNNTAELMARIRAARDSRIQTYRQHTTPRMTLSEWVAARQRCVDMEEMTSDPEDRGVPGISYPGGCWIFTPGRDCPFDFHTTIANEPIVGPLSVVENRLYDWAVSEGLVIDPGVSPTIEEFIVAEFRKAVREVDEGPNNKFNVGWRNAFGHIMTKFGLKVPA